MSFYLAFYEVDEKIIARETALEAMEYSRIWIDMMPEYHDMGTAELLDLAFAGDLEIDIVEIQDEFPANQTQENLYRFYQNYAMGRIPPLPIQ